MGNLKSSITVVALAAYLLVGGAGPASAGDPLGSGFSFQGQLKQGGAPLNNTADFECTLWDAAAAGNQIGGLVAIDNVNVVDGLFTLQVNAGGEFGTDAMNGEARWLEIAVRSPTGGGDFTALNPRTELTATPYAKALSALRTEQFPLGANVIAGHPNNSVDDGIWGATLSGGGEGNGPNVITGILGTIGGGAGNVAWQLATVSGGGANRATAEFSTIGGGLSNRATADYSTVPGGENNTAAGRNSFAAGSGAKANHNNAFVWSHGQFQSTAANQFLIRADGGVGIGTNAPVTALDVAGTVTATSFSGDGSALTNLPVVAGVWSVNGANISYDAGNVGIGKSDPAEALDIAGNLHADGSITSGNSITIDGIADTITSTGNLELHVSTARALRLEAGGTSPNVIGGRGNNSVAPSISSATIAGGGDADYPNLITNDWGSIGGGRGNSAGRQGTVGGGSLNTASGHASTVGGGSNNAATAAGSTVGGGSANNAIASSSTVGGGSANNATGYLSTVPGGYNNSAAGEYSFAAGRRAKADHDGAFVWADSTDADFTSTAPDQFLISAAGGVGIGEANPSAALDVVGTTELNGNVGIGTSSPQAMLQVRSKPVDSGVFNAESTAGAMLKSSNHNGGDTPAAPEAVLVLAREGISGEAYANYARFDLSRYEESYSRSRTQLDIRLTHDVLQDNNTPTILTMRSNGKVGIGTTDPQYKLDVNGWTRTHVLQITGGSDIAEPYDIAPYGQGEPLPGMVVSIDPDQLGKMRVSGVAYDRKVAGIISGANGIKPGLTLTQEGTVADGALPVASVGRVWCWCDADANGPIQAGDLLTSSATPGHAMKVSQRDRSQGATIGKAMSSLSTGRGMVLVLVSLQ